MAGSSLQAGEGEGGQERSLGQAGVRGGGGTCPLPVLRACSSFAPCPLPSRLKPLSSVIPLQDAPRPRLSSFAPVPDNQTTYHAPPPSLALPPRPLACLSCRRATRQRPRGCCSARWGWTRGWHPS